MSTETLNSQKLDLISWITELEDEDILNQIKKIQEESISIPQWQQEEVLKRYQASLENPNLLSDFDEAMNEIEKDI